MKWLAAFFAIVNAIWLGFLGLTWEREVSGQDMQFLSGLAQLRNDEVGAEVRADLVILQNVGTMLFVLAALSLAGAVVVMKRGRTATWLFFAAPLAMLVGGLLQSLMPMDVVFKVVAVSSIPAGIAGLFAMGVKGSKRYAQEHPLPATS